MSKAELHDVTDETLAAAHDAHYLAGELMADRVDAEKLAEGARQMERAARKLKKLAEAAALAKNLKGAKE
jgi:hypothetical protein